MQPCSSCRSPIPAAIRPPHRFWRNAWHPASCARRAPCRSRWTTIALVLATADPLDDFTPAAVAAACGRHVTLEVAVPIELEAALERLYPAEGHAEEAQPEARTPLEEDAERLKDLASEAPVIRLVNQIITRAVETNASDIHVEPFRGSAARALSLRRHPARGGQSADPARRGDHLAHQDHGAARHRRAAAAAGRPHPTGGARPGDRLPRLHRAVAARRDGGAAHPRPHRGGVRLREAGAAAGGDRPASRTPWRCRTASCW